MRCLLFWIFSGQRCRVEAPLEVEGCGTSWMIRPHSAAHRPHDETAAAPDPTDRPIAKSVPCVCFFFFDQDSVGRGVKFIHSVKCGLFVVERYPHPQCVPARR